MAKEKNTLPENEENRLPAPLYAELQARRNGFEGGWPPKQEAMGKTPDAVLQQLSRLQEGDHRTSLVSAVSRGLWAYIESFDPKDFRAYGRAMKEIIRSPENKTAPKCETINWVIRAYIEVLETLVQKKSLPDVSPIRHIMMCMHEFFDEVGPDDIRVMVETLRLGAYHGSHKSKLRTARTVMKSFQRMLELYRDAYQVFVAEADDAEWEQCPRVVKAKEILADMRERAQRDATD